MIGSVWAAGSWGDDAWADGSWADVGAGPEPEPEEALGGGTLVRTTEADVESIAALFRRKGRIYATASKASASAYGTVVAPPVIEPEPEPIPEPVVITGRTLCMAAKANAVGDGEVGLGEADIEAVMERIRHLYEMGGSL